MHLLPDPPAPVAWTLSGRRVAVMVDEGVYPVPVVVRAAYRLTDRAHVFVHRCDGELAVVIRPKDDRVTADELVGALANELLDQRIRADLAAEFREIHSSIVAEAFAPVRGRPE